MSVNIIRKQSGQANEVTDAMLEAIGKQAKWQMDRAIIRPMSELVGELRDAMEAARIAEVGEIERIEVAQDGDSVYPDFTLESGHGFVSLATDKDVGFGNIRSDNLIPLAEALLELGKQMKGAV